MATMMRTTTITFCLEEPADGALSDLMAMYPMLKV
jgi:hypothetical protein